MASQNPRALGRYLLQEPVATGTTATVWRALDTKRNLPVAVKLFHPHVVDDENGRRRMEAEAKLARQVRHPNIVSAIDVISRRGEFALVFPYVAGETLAARLKTTRALAPTTAAGIAADIGDALTAVHAAGFVHRDVKPGNILIGENGRGRLLDFGISRSVSDSVAAEQTLTGAGLAIGTLPYMAPEQLSAAPITAATDVFALGVVLYEMLAGARPFEAASPVGLAAEQRVPPPPIEGAPAPLANVSARALAVDPAARPTAAECVTALRAWLAMPVRADAPTAPVATVPPVLVARPGSRRNQGMLTALVAAAGLLIVALVGLAALPLPTTNQTGAPSLAPAVIPLVSPAPTPTVAPKATPNAKAPAVVPAVNPTPTSAPANPAPTTSPAPNPSPSPSPKKHGHHGHRRNKKHKD